MRTESHEDLQKQLESLLRWLVEDIGGLLRQSPRIEPTVPTTPPGAGGLPADIEDVRGGSAGDMGEWTAEKLQALVCEFREAIQSCLQAAPGDSLVRSQELGSPGEGSILEELRRLQEAWTELLTRVLTPSFPVELEDVQGHFTETLLLRRVRLGQLLEPSVENSGETQEATARVVLLYDPSRGLLVRCWAEADPGSRVRLEQSQERLQKALGAVRRGALIIGDASFATSRIFDEFSHRGLHGVFPLRPERAHTLLGIRQAGHLSDGVLDWPVRLKSGGKPLPLRILSRMRGESHDAAVTNVIDRRLLEASKALRIISAEGRNRWCTERMVAAARPWMSLARASRSGQVAASVCVPLLEKPEMQFHAAILMDSVFRGVRWWFDRGFDEIGPAGRGAGAEAESRQILGRLLGQTAALVARVLRPSPELPGGTQTRPSGVRRPEALLPGRAVEPASREELQGIAESRLEPAFEPFSRSYARVGHRNPFLWRWVQHGLELTRLPSIDSALRSRNRTAKLLGVMLDVLLDDVADNFKDGRLLEALLEIPYGAGSTKAAGVPSARVEYYRFAVEVWSAIDTLARSFSRYGEFEEILEFDYRQLLNTMRYAYLVNRTPQLLNSTEHDLYQPHNMHMMISGTLDLMCSSGFDVEELSLVRQALWHGQVMGRIGNMVSTWEREIQEGDFTSGVFAATIERGVLAAADLAVMAPAELASTIESSGVIRSFLGEWERLRGLILEIADKVTSVDLFAYAAGLGELLRFHLGSRGLK